MLPIFLVGHMFVIDMLYNFLYYRPPFNANMGVTTIKYILVTFKEIKENMFSSKIPVHCQLIFGRQTKKQTKKKKQIAKKDCKCQQIFGSNKSDQLMMMNTNLSNISYIFIKLCKDFIILSKNQTVSFTITL